jgi:predicted nucleic acid-binding protein
MSPLLRSLLEQAEQLVPEEQLELIGHIAEQLKSRKLAEAKRQSITPLPRHKLSEFRGIVQSPMLGEDAQEWVSRTRREGTEHRERILPDSLQVAVAIVAGCEAILTNDAAFEKITELQVLRLDHLLLP